MRWMRRVFCGAFYHSAVNDIFLRCISFFADLDRIPNYCSLQVTLYLVEGKIL